MMKFRPAAKRNAVTIPLSPPTAPPIATKSAVRPAISTKTFRLLILSSVSVSPNAQKARPPRARDLLPDHREGLACRTQRPTGPCVALAQLASPDAVLTIRPHERFQPAWLLPFTDQLNQSDPVVIP